MPKFEKNEMFLKIPFEELCDTDNVRTVAIDDSILELAESIKKNGLLQPLVVRPARLEKTGNNEFKQYDIVSGHRRFYAIAELRTKGHDFNLVPCVIQASGKLKTLQMIENIQRKDLEQQDKEKAIKEMLDAGMTAKQIAEEFSKQISWVTDIIAGMNVRAEAENAGVDTSKIGTRALAQLRSIPKEEQPAAVQKLSKAGGSNRAATEIMRESKAEKDEEITAPISEIIDAPEIEEPEIEDSPKSVKTERTVEYTDTMIRIKSDTCEFLENYCTENNFPSFGYAIDYIVHLARKKKLI